MAVAPVSTASAAANINAGIGSLANNYETFLKLLTTQLKNQDPLSPLDTNQFTQQLTQMTGVQQQLLTNQLLTQLISQDQAGLGSSAVNMMGKTVTVSDPEVTLTNSAASWDYTLGKGVSGATLSVLDANGKTVWSGKAPATTVGDHTFNWNGKDLAGRQVPDGGAYTLQVDASDATGKRVTSTVQITGVASRVQTVNGQPYLTIGTAKAPLSAVTSISAPVVATNTPTTAPTPTPTPTPTPAAGG
jgi:flagellar basal-body rod modification protein FlgD